MSTEAPVAQTRRKPHVTHVVQNQVPELEDLDLFSTNLPVVEALEREGAGWARQLCAESGRRWGGDPIRWGFEANDNEPQLKSHDRFGRRVDEVEFHPSWHRLMELASREGVHNLPWLSDKPGAHVARAVLALGAMQPEAGIHCPMTMTFAVIPALRHNKGVYDEWFPLLTASGYDGRLLPAGEKGSAKAGMGMTEKQGGSDVRANQTRAEPLGGDEYLLAGHKWFCSAPMSDLFLILAQTPEGPGCFAVPRILPDGSRNSFRIQRLKRKLGNRSNASSEVEFDQTWARLVGEPGRGVPTIIEMVNHTRLDCTLGSAAGMRWAVANATWHAAHRRAFGRRLADQPLMQNVLADLCIESEAATAMTVRLARAYDEDDLPLKRLGTAVSKYWVCKRFPGLAFEAMECLGGNGFVEESPMPRLYREAPLNSIWEGSGNVNALDVLRAITRQPAVLDGFLFEVEKASGADPRFDRFATRLRGDLAHADAELTARSLVERLAVSLQASLLLRHAPHSVADAFCASRLGGGSGLQYGALPGGIDLQKIIDRHTPDL